jgi:hypothetical protein
VLQHRFKDRAVEFKVLFLIDEGIIPCVDFGEESVDLRSMHLAQHRLRLPKKQDHFLFWQAGEIVALGKRGREVEEDDLIHFRGEVDAPVEPSSFLQQCRSIVLEGSHDDSPLITPLLEGSCIEGDIDGEIGDALDNLFRKEGGAEEHTEKNLKQS